MPTSLRTRRILQARRQNVRRQYDTFMSWGLSSTMAVDTLSRLINVSRATLYKDLAADRKEARG